MTPPKGLRCQVCEEVVKRISKSSEFFAFDETIDYCNRCKSCGSVVHKSCVEQLRDIQVAGDFWICDCGTRNKIYQCEDYETYYEDR